MMVHAAKKAQTEPIRYSILDPTGNVTALVETALAENRRKEVAAVLMERHPEVEQVGFTDFENASKAGEHTYSGVRLDMAGGEFCGNAAMSAAALFLYDKEAETSEAVVRLCVSGAGHPVDVRLERTSADSFYAGIHMPQPLDIISCLFHAGSISAEIPVVKMEGIFHMIVESGNAFFSLKENKKKAEQTVKTWCRELSAEGLGLLFLEQIESAYYLTPLVYVPGSGTVFWESSCASGSAAAGMYMAQKTGTAVSLTLQEPGGILRVESNPLSRETLLFGTTRLVFRDSFCFPLNS